LGGGRHSGGSGVDIGSSDHLDLEGAQGKAMTISIAGAGNQPPAA